jgi:alpha-D-ribose 1-methylphosphonate 5-triphosphate synthase subunit PhnH
MTVSEGFKSSCEADAAFRRLLDCRVKPGNDIPF